MVIINIIDRMRPAKFVGFKVGSKDDWLNAASFHDVDEGGAVKASWKAELDIKLQWLASMRSSSLIQLLQIRNPPEYGKR